MEQFGPGWGYNQHGQLGDGTTTQSNIPIQVTSLTGITDISGGWESTLALKSDGTVWSWGLNDYGQLGNGNNTNSDIPIQVINLCPVINALNENVNPLSFSIFPNPSNGIFNLEMPQLAGLTKGDLGIYNSLGEKIFSGTILSGTNEIYLPDLPNGIYLITVQTGKKIFTRKIMIQE